MAERLVDDIPGLAIRVSHDGPKCVAQLEGELDVSSSERLRAELIRLIDDGCRDLVVDLSALAMIDSTGLGVLVGVMKRSVQHGGSMILRSPRPAARRVFDITGLDRVFVIAD